MEGMLLRGELSEPCLACDGCRARAAIGMTKTQSKTKQRKETNMGYRGNIDETEARKAKVRERVTELKRNLHHLSNICVTPSIHIIQAIFRLLDAIKADETLEGRDY